MIWSAPRNGQGYRLAAKLLHDLGTVVEITNRVSRQMARAVPEMDRSQCEEAGRKIDLALHQLSRWPSQSLRRKNRRKTMLSKGSQPKSCAPSSGPQDQLERVLRFCPDGNPNAISRQPAG